MKRKEALENSLVEDKNIKNLVESTLKEDAKFIKREFRSLQDSIEDLESDLIKRMSSTTPIDKSVIEVLYQTLTNKKLLLETYKAFNKEFGIVELLS